MHLPRPRVAQRRRTADDEQVMVRPVLLASVGRLRRLLADQRGINLIELMTAMAVMLIVVSTLAGVFVSGSNAEIDLRNRFEAQSRARLALDKFRREVHNACRAVVSGAVSTPTGTRYSSITLWRLSAPNPSFTCDPGVASASWCVLGSSAPYTLYRKSGASCDSTGVQWGDSLVTNGAFAIPSAAASLLPRIDVNLVVDMAPVTPNRRYTLTDAIALRSYHRNS